MVTNRGFDEGTWYVVWVCADGFVAFQSDGGDDRSRVGCVCHEPRQEGGPEAVMAFLWEK